MLEQLVGYSGSQVDFCREHGIGVSSLRYHLSRQNRAEERGDQALGDGFVVLGRVGGQGPSGSDWVELTVGRISVKVWADTDLAVLRVALRAAVEACGPI
jgi:hypothetical protein